MSVHTYVCIDMRVCVRIRLALTVCVCIAVIIVVRPLLANAAS